MNIDGNIIANLITIGGVIVVQLVILVVTTRTLRHQANQSKLEREFAATEAKRIEWKNFLISLIQTLMEARKEYEQFLGTDKTDNERHAGIVGKAIAVCLATNDDEMARLAEHDLTPYFVNDVGKPEWKTRNRNAIHDATRRLATLIRQA